MEIKNNTTIKQSLNNQPYAFTTNLVTNKAQLQQLARKLIYRRDTGLKTKNDYFISVRPFLRFVSIYGMKNSTFIDYKNYVRDNMPDKSISTKNKYLITARIFIKECVRDQIINRDITIGVKQFKDNKRHRVEGLNIVEVKRLLVKLKTMRLSYRKIRLQVIVYLLLYQGLRQVEIERLMIQNINFKTKEAFITGKARDDLEKIHLHKKLLTPIRKLIKITGARKNHLVRSYDFKTPISTRQINREVKYLFSISGVDKKVHGIRHFYITHLLNLGVDLREVQKLARHKKIETTIRYDDEINIKKKADEINSRIIF